MSEQEKMDGLLREMMAAVPAPCLSSDFDQRMKRGMRPRRLDATGRWVMTAYTIVALIVSIWAMRSQSFNWIVIAAAILAPLSVVGVVQLGQRSPGSGRG